MLDAQRLAIVAIAFAGTVSAASMRGHHAKSASSWDSSSYSCTNGGQSVSVVGWTQPGCIDKDVQMCVATYSDGACPDGAECVWLSYDQYDNPVYGCKPAKWYDCDDNEATCGNGEISVSVVGWKEPGCVYDDPNNDYDICVASYYWGSCPEGSACGFVTYDQYGDPVYGCYAMDLTEDGDTCVPVSVVGWEYSGCIDSEDDMCVADNSDGKCPSGSSCSPVQWDASWNPSVWGCVDNYYYDYDDSDCASYQAPCDEGYDEIGVVGWSANGCVPSGSNVCVADVYDGVCPDYSVCAHVNYDYDNYEYVWGCVAEWDYYDDYYYGSNYYSDDSSYYKHQHKKQGSSQTKKTNASKSKGHRRSHKKHSHK